VTQFETSDLKVQDVLISDESFRVLEQRIDTVPAIDQQVGGDAPWCCVEGNLIVPVACEDGETSAGHPALEHQFSDIVSVAGIDSDCTSLIESEVQRDPIGAISGATAERVAHKHIGTGVGGVNQSVDLTNISAVIGCLEFELFDKVKRMVQLWQFAPILSRRRCSFDLSVPDQENAGNLLLR
jgi:hypothetical protein